MDKLGFLGTLKTAFGAWGSVAKEIATNKEDDETLTGAEKDELKAIEMEQKRIKNSSKRLDVQKAQVTEPEIKGKKREKKIQMER